jgi:hypothetical protein
MLALLGIMLGFASGVVVGRVTALRALPGVSDWAAGAKPAAGVEQGGATQASSTSHAGDSTASP